MPKHRRSDSVDGSMAKALKHVKIDASAGDGPLLDNHIKTVLSEANERASRFLYRVWYRDESKRVNASEAGVVPRLLLSEDAPYSIFDVSKDKLLKCLHDHVTGEQQPSMFSSWTESLHEALELLKVRIRDEKGRFRQARDAYISVIDTKEMGSGVTVFHTSALAQLGVHGHHDNPSLIVFGAVRCPWHRAVSLTAFEHDDWWNASPEVLKKDVALEVSYARRFGGIFGGHFELPISATVLAMYTHNGDVLQKKGGRRLKYLQRALQDYDIPSAWAHDPTITSDLAIFGNDHRKYKRSLVLLGALARSRCSTVGKQMHKRSIELAEKVKEAYEKASSRQTDLGWESEEDDPAYDPEHHPEPEDVEMSDGEPEMDEALPAGRMDDLTKQKIISVACRTPRYLFRAWNNTEGKLPGSSVQGRISGGNPALNSLSAITPHFFLDRPEL